MRESEPLRSRGEVYEGLAFTFCKTALLVLILNCFALPVTAAAASACYLLAVWHGKKDTRCFARYPLFIALFWAIVAGVAVYRMVGPR